MSSSPVTGNGRVPFPLSLNISHMSASYNSVDSPSGGGGGDPEFLSPAPLSLSRHASLPSAIFSLVSTIIGGGVLSIPFAFKNTGIITGAIFLILIAVASDFSIYILMSCSRRVEGGKTYEEVVQRAFGSGALLCTVTLLFCLIYLCCVAYLILIRDLICPIVELALGHPITHTYRVLVVLVVVLLILPLCLQRSLHALRFTSVISFLSVVVLAVTITYRTLQREFGGVGGVGVSVGEGAGVPGVDVGVGVGGLKWSSSSWHSAVYAFPIMSVAYLCHFNVLPIHGDLIRPTRTRIKSFVNWVIVVCTALYLEIGLMGYWYAREQTVGNILNNFSSDDLLISLGRVGLGFTCCCSFPLLVLPCRAVGQRIIQLASAYLCRSPSTHAHGDAEAGHNTHEYEPICTIDDSDRGQHSHAHSHVHSVGRSADVPVESSVDMSKLVASAPSARSASRAPVPPSWFVSEPSLVVQTVVIVGSSFLLSTVVQSVAVMWSILGSTVSILIAYIIPAACYLKIRGGGLGRARARGRAATNKPLGHSSYAYTVRVVCAWLLLLLGVVCLVLCSYQAVASLLWYQTAA